MSEHSSILDKIKNGFWAVEDKAVVLSPNDIPSNVQTLYSLFLQVHQLGVENNDLVQKRYDQIQNVGHQIETALGDPLVASCKDYFFLTLTVYMELDQARKLLSFCIHDCPVQYTMNEKTAEALVHTWKETMGSPLRFDTETWHVALRLLYLKTDLDLFDSLTKQSLSPPNKMSVESVYFAPIEKWAELIPGILSIVDPQQVPAHIPMVRLPVCSKSDAKKWVEKNRPENGHKCLDWITHLWNQHLIEPKYMRNLAFYLIRDMRLANFVPLYGAAILDMESLLYTGHQQAYAHLLWFLCVQYHKAFFLHTMIECERIFSTYAWTQQTQSQKRVYELAHVRMQQIISRLTRLSEWMNTQDRARKDQDPKDRGYQDRGHKDQDPGDRGRVLGEQVLDTLKRYQTNWLHVAEHMRLQDIDASPQTLKRLRQIHDTTNKEDALSQWFGRHLLDLCCTSAFLCQEYLNMSQWPVLLQALKSACDVTGTKVLGPEIPSSQQEKQTLATDPSQGMGLFHYATLDFTQSPNLEHLSVTDLHKNVFCLVLQHWLLSDNEDTKQVIYHTLALTSEEGKQDFSDHSTLVDFLQNLIDCHMIELLCTNSDNLDITLSDQAKDRYATLPTETLLHMLDMVHEKKSDSLALSLPDLQSYTILLHQELEHQISPNTERGRNPSESLPPPSSRLRGRPRHPNQPWKVWDPFWDLKMAKHYT